MQDYHHEAFYVTGYKVTTTNKDFASRTDIMNAWKAWRETDIAGTIVGKLRDTLHCVYFNYTNPENLSERGYDMLIGFYTEEGAIQTNPELTTIKIPEQDYKYDMAVGEMPIALISKWKEINEMSMDELPRSFQYDMDMYLDDGVCIAVGVDK
jgi:predicted transcriptional regulator YdeE